MPLLTNILAIQRALAKNIRESLNIFRNGINEVFVKIIKLSNFGISVFEIVLGTTLSVFGFLIYFVAPAAFAYGKLKILFLIMTIVLVGMIIGLAFL
jgi:hypothetical protein